MELHELMKEECILLDIEETDKEKALTKIVSALAAQSLLRDSAEVERAILARERLMSTGVGSGIAIPHAKTDGVSNIVIAMATSKEGIKFKSPDKRDVKVIFMLIVPKEAVAENLKILTLIAKILRGNNRLIDDILSQTSEKAVIELIAKEEKAAR